MSLRRGPVAALLGGTLLLGACGDDDSPTVMRPAEPEPTCAEKRGWGGATIYDEVCDKCHKMGVDQAPIVGDTEAWAPRLAKGEEILYRHVREGFNEMPARGDCAFCSNEQLRAALQYMLASSRAPGPGAE